MKYFFLIASLPGLSLDAPPTLTVGKFRKMCEGWLTERELSAVDEVLTANESRSHNPFLLRWRDRETQLRNAVVRQRAAKLSVDPESHLRDHGAVEAATEKLVSNIFMRQPTLGRELELDRHRWQIVDEVAGHDPYRLSGILAYALKLRIAERWAHMDERRGREALEELARKTA